LGANAQARTGKILDFQGQGGKPEPVRAGVRTILVQEFTMIRPAGTALAAAFAILVTSVPSLADVPRTATPGMILPGVGVSGAEILLAQSRPSRACRLLIYTVCRSGRDGNRFCRDAQRWVCDEAGRR